MKIGACEEVDAVDIMDLVDAASHLRVSAFK
jgi:hypothetical protein